MREAVVLIHGIWMVGLEMLVLRRRLEAWGFQCHQFRYHSLGQSPHQNAIRLDAFIKKLDADIVHLLAHSLGGIVILHLFELDPSQRPGRVLMLGTPINGSAFARKMYASSLTRLLLGRSVERGLLGDAPPWNGARDLGMIAGTRGFGVAKLLFGGLERPNDGAVALAETHSEEISAHLTVPCSHSGMLWSSQVLDAACHFLHYGTFSSD